MMNRLLMIQTEFHASEVGLHVAEELQSILRRVRHPWLDRFFRFDVIGGDGYAAVGNLHEELDAPFVIKAFRRDEAAFEG